MHQDLAGLVQPVFMRGLDLRRRLEAGQAPSIEPEQATLEDLIRRVSERAERPASEGPGEATGGTLRPASTQWVEDVQYALACWLDELFILSSPWDAAWTESKLEARLFGSNDRSWRFWERAAAAERLPRPDALEVFYLCVALGFRGELAADPTRLRSWIDRALRRVGEPGRKPEAAAMEPACNVPPLHGGHRLRAMVFAAGCLAIATIPVLVLAFGRR